MQPGETAAFRFTVESNGASQRSAGFNLAVTAGTLGLVEGQGARLIEFPFRSGQFELTHSSSKANNNGRASWDFTWTAPGEPGVYVLYGSGNSVNRSSSSAGDRSTSDVYGVSVVAPTATATLTVTAEPSVTPTAPATSTRRDTPTATATRSASATPTPSGTPTPTPAPSEPGPARGDANCDGGLNAADIARLLRILSDPGTAQPCELADADCDEEIDLDDLNLLFSLIFGGPPAPTCEPGAGAAQLD